jgi:hypothetical protein
MVVPSGGRHLLSESNYDKCLSTARQEVFGLPPSMGQTQPALVQQANNAIEHECTV